MNKNIFKSTLFLCMVWMLLAMPAFAAMDKNAGVILADDQGEILYAQNRNQDFTPASTLKILTSLAAVDYFGRTHRFKTLYAYDRVSKNLYVKGLGDPLFISEVIQDLCRQILIKTKARAINNIILDHSFFHPDIKIPGTGNSLNPYDATSGALCANFNTLSFRWDTLHKRYLSAEPQTPLLKGFIEDIMASGQKQGRILLSPKQRRDYPGQLIKFFLTKRGVPIKGIVHQGRFNPADGQTFSYESPFTLEENLQKLLKYSNNFMANQLILTMGADKEGSPATLAKGVNVLTTFARKDLGLAELIITEGSGISRANKISPTQMLRILMGFMPFHDLLNKEGNEYYKTGTLSDVRCRAGFLIGKDKRLYPFSIMINEENKGYDSIHRDLLRRVNMITKGN